MTPRDVAALACRMLALSLFVILLSTIVAEAMILLGEFSQIFSPGLREWDMLLISGLMAGVWLFRLAIIWFVWGNAKWLSRKIVPDEENRFAYPYLRAKDLQVAAFSAVGLISFLAGLRSLLTVLHGMSLVFRGFTPHESLLDWLISGESLSALLSILLGLILMVGSRGLVRMINGLRVASRPTRDDSDAEDESMAPQRSEI